MYILFFILWFVFNGRITLELLILGLLITVAIAALATKVFGYTPSNEIRLWKNFPLICVYIGNLIWEIMKASFAVMSVIYSTKKKPEPMIVEFYSKLPNNYMNVILANSITLTPGTFTILQDDDHFVVHCLCKEYAEGMEESSFVHLLRRIK